MNIKKLLKSSLIFVIPFIIIVYFLYCINILSKDFSYGHKSHNFNPGAIQWVSYNLLILKLKFKNIIFNKNYKVSGLNRIDLFIPEKTSRKLLENVPSSTKKYLRSNFLTKNNFRDVRLRYLGDNPGNWMFEQKSIRLKTRKRELINRQRYFEYRATQINPLLEYVPFILAKELGLLVSEINLVEVFVNKKSNGIYIERERLNESFLRRNKIMPVNMYKGEQSNNIENKIGLESDLFKNSGLWDKISVFNIYPEENKNDLKTFLENIKKANDSRLYLRKILEFGNIDNLSKKSVLEIINQNVVYSYGHNQRTAIDSWSGKIYHIPHDSYYNSDLRNRENLVLELVETDLDRILNQSSNFLNAKYKFLYEAIILDKVVDKVISNLINIKEKYLISSERDIGKIQRYYVSGSEILDNEEEIFNKIINSLKYRKDEILKIYNNKISSTWEEDQGDLYIKVKQVLPITNLEFKFKNNTPEWIAIDYNSNNILDDEDIYFFKKKGNSFLIDINLFSNRILLNDLSNISLNGQIDLRSQSHIEIVNTKFKFFVSNKTIPDQIFSFNIYNNKKFELIKNKSSAFSPSVNNIPIIKNYEKKIINFSGDINVDKDLVIYNIAKIQEGTVFNLAEDASIIFKNKVIAQGKVKNPIIFKKKNNNAWGTIALHGKKTKGSILKNILIDGGTGDIINGINYFSSFSLHSTQDLTLENIEVKNNFEYDDMVHIIYSKNLNIKNLKLINAYRDAIDIDISKNIYLENIGIYNSGNDALDIMESSVVLNDSYITNSGDKGISVGEGSDIIVEGTTIEKSKYGIASKDSSTAKINNSIFQNNKIHLSTYKKNWRYGESGIIAVQNSVVSSNQENLFMGDLYGKIEIESSTINGEINKQGNVLIN